MKIILAFIHDLFSEWMMVGQINITEWAEEVKKKKGHAFDYDEEKVCDLCLYGQTQGTWGKEMQH